MTDCIYCIDNDILKKLATFDLFDETARLFDITPEQINVLATAKYKFRGDLKKLQNGRLRKPEDQIINYEKTLELAEKLPQIAEADVDRNLFTLLSQFDEIDQGEAILTVYMAQLLQKEGVAQAAIFTGDKRYMRALAQVDIPEIQETLTHRFWCVEQLVLRNIQTYGFEFVRDKIVPVRDCDTALKSVFGSGDLVTESNSVATLKDYIEELRADTGSLLHPYPSPANS